MSPSLNFSDNYFQLFGLPVGFAVDSALVSERYRQLQSELHPDRFASASDHEKRLAIQYSARVNEAYETLRRPLPRALYLLELAGLSEEEISRQKVAGGFLIMQMELREKLEALPELVDPDEALEHLVSEINADLRLEQAAFGDAFTTGEIDIAAGACVRMQYLDKLLQEAERIEADLMDD